MDGFQEAKRLDDNSTGNTVFDASQYAFFGNDIAEEVELGGLEDEEDIHAVGVDEEYQLDQEEGDGLGCFSDIDDLSNTFSKLNKVVNGPGSAGFIGDRGSRESSSVAEWAQENDYSNLYDQHLYHPEDVPQNKRWSSQPYSLGQFADSKPLHRTSSYPDPQPHLLPQPHQNFSSEPIPVPKSSIPSYPPGGRPQMLSPTHNVQHPNNQYLPGGPQMVLHSQKSFSGPLTGLPHGSQFAANLPHQFSPPTHPDSRPPNQWSNRANLMNNLMQQQLPHQNGMMPPHLMAQQQQQQQQQQQYRMNHQVPPPFGHLAGMPSQLHGPHMAQSPPMLNKFDAMMGIPDLRDQRPRSAQKNRPSMPYFQQGFDANSRGGWPQYRSKYMTSDEIENILRMQLAATHTNDPYVDDYYHQACLAQKTSGARLKHHFCPTQLRDLPPRARPNDEPHPFLQVEALGRIPFSSIRRPKPLLEVDPPSSTSTGSTEQKIIDKPLEQEPMLAARVTIEDCLCLLLDIDDIDRFLQFNQFPDGGAELRQRRQSLLEELAASLQLVDPLGKGGQTLKDDFVFVRIISLPKGRKLIGKYLQTLSPGSELLRIVCMAIFRHLRFLFGVLPSDPTAIEAIANLVRVISSCVSGMDLNGLSACLAAVVCSPEPPPLRPIGSSVGDGASVVIKSVLDRATEILRDPHATGNYSAPNPAFWQASFDEFFMLLLKYCYNKYESIVQPLHMQASLDMAALGSDIARAIKREMPVELLRASLPHTNEHQRKLLMDLAQRSVPIVSSGGHGGNGS